MTGPTSDLPRGVLRDLRELAELSTDLLDVYAKVERALKARNIQFNRVEYQEGWDAVPNVCGVLVDLANTLFNRWLGDLSPDLHKDRREVMALRARQIDTLFRLQSDLPDDLSPF